MFIQFIFGRAGDPAALREAFARWEADLAPGAAGWLGSTAGIAADGTFAATAMFESVEAARRNGDRPEQGEWWARTAGAFAGEPTFLDSAAAGTLGAGATGEAGFVQVIRGSSTDPARAYELMAGSESLMREFRPDVLGSVYGYTADGATVDLIFFSSEAEARANEHREPPAEARELMAQMEGLSKVDQFIDLTDPWHLSPR
ncbi:hypothetical protein GCM10010123_45120 [Pilimelia anulata]|uniref:Uncharacterized protein n=2 Tax=Pilimelia anulata TaxID=53371 RepID=A0A8J3BGW7_9ACTN|nr:hypothetical protein GCM10010123_45120 [Pilimelia anulata]